MRSVKSFHGVPIAYMNYQAQALYLEIGNKANDSLEIMHWYKETADKHNKDFAPQKQT